MKLPEDVQQIVKWMLIARKEGVGVVEISRALNWKTATVYDLLRENGVIDPIPPRRYYSTDNDGIHSRFLDAMKRVGLSPERWARSWGYELSELIEYTAEGANLKDPDIKSLHKALSRDFGREYLALYKRVPAEPISFPENPCKTFVATRDGEGRTFVAHVAELEDYEDAPTAKGSSPSQAVANLEKKIVLFLQQYRLNVAIEHVRRISA